jgi:hypothetical protein
LNRRLKMMSSIRKIGSILLVTLVIATTGGFSIYQHVCLCFGNSSSIFIKATCEHDHSSEKASCCMPENTPSCCAEKPAPVSESNFHKDHCCKNFSQFLKINDSFQPRFEKVTLKPLTLASVILNYAIPVDDNSLSALNLFNSSLPPPDSGKQILVAHHQLKLAPALV